MKNLPTAHRIAAILESDNSATKEEKHKEEEKEEKPKTEEAPKKDEASDKEYVSHHPRKLENELLTLWRSDSYSKKFDKLIEEFETEAKKHLKRKLKLSDADFDKFWYDGGLDNVKKRLFL